MKILELIYRLGVVPVIKIDEIEDVKPISESLISGGLPIAEITLRTPEAVGAIRKMSENFPEIVVGAGTVLNCQQVDEAVEAGAQFIVTPGFNPQTVEYCLERDIPIFPGCTTASDMERAYSYGLKVVKFFPAETSGGLSTIKSLSGPFPGIKFMPTGGINRENLNAYLESDQIVACGGSWMVNDDFISQNNFDKIKLASQDAVNEILGLSFEKIVVNKESQDNIDTELLRQLLAFKFKSLVVSETKNSPYTASNGYITLSTNNIYRAIHHLTLKGLKFQSDSKEFDSNDRLKSVFLEGDIVGFSFCLIDKKYLD